MKRGILFLTIILLAAFWNFKTEAQVAPPPRLVAQGDLEKLVQGKEETIEAGGGVFFKISPQEMFRQNMIIFDKKIKVVGLEGGRFIAYARIESGPTIYWIIGEYTGGAHCCGVYHFLSRPEGGQPVRYLGKTTGHNGGPLPLGGLCIYHQGQLYFKDLDNRFDYFHASHADSRLVNFPPRFYHLTSASLKVSNLPFKEVYLRKVSQVEEEISKNLTLRRVKPPALLKSGFAPGFMMMEFTDPLGQLLIKRTILYLYARQDQEAWQTLERDVPKYYQTTDWLKELGKDILEHLSAAPY
ncbi:MAG: hypothetical protein Q8M54_07200 [Desulfobaccales bacterium]|nr:hypothetical protein [Desulfobaccales bacterium]